MPSVYFNGSLYKGSLSYTDLVLTVCSLINDSMQECVGPVKVMKVDVVSIIVPMITAFVGGLLILFFVCRALAKRRYLRQDDKRIEQDS